MRPFNRTKGPEHLGWISPTIWVRIFTLFHCGRTLVSNLIRWIVAWRRMIFRLYCLLSATEVVVIYYNWSLDLQGSTSPLLWSVRHFKFFHVKGTCSPWSFSGWTCHPIQRMTWTYLPYLGCNWCLWTLLIGWIGKVKLSLRKADSCRSTIICVRERERNG